jgi:hypothetical protein
MLSKIMRQSREKVSASIIGLLLATGGVSQVWAQGSGQQAQTAQATESKDDRLFMKNGQVLVGKIVRETTDNIVFRLKLAGMETEVTYERNLIDKVVRSTSKIEAEPEVAAKATETTASAPNAGFIAGDGTRYSIIELTGEFGTEISQTPIRQALKNAREQKADIVIFVLDAKWEQSPLEPLPNDAANFDEVFRAEDIVPILVEEVPNTWEKAPRIVFWVKKAMAGASMLPLVAKEIYFSPEGTIGGIGNLTFMMQGQGDEVVREKQRSLRMGHAEGWAIRGGYDYRIIQAMARIEYVLSVRYKDGKPELFEGMPSNPSEELLTDNGMNENADDVVDRVNGVGNDVLTLNERNARMLGLSKGTVATKDELLDALGLSRGAVDVSDKSTKIMASWKSGIQRAQDQIRRLIRDYGELEVEQPGDYDARTKFRNQQRRILREMRAILKQWGEGISPRFLYENRIPSDVELESIDKSIEIDQQRDRKDR